MVVKFSAVADLFVFKQAAFLHFSFLNFISSVMVGTHCNYRGWNFQINHFLTCPAVRAWLWTQSWLVRGRGHSGTAFHPNEKKLEEKPALHAFRCSCARIYFLGRSSHLATMKTQDNMLRVVKKRKIERLGSLMILSTTELAQNPTWWVSCPVTC